MPKVTDEDPNFERFSLPKKKKHQNKAQNLH